MKLNFYKSKYSKKYSPSEYEIKNICVIQKSEKLKNIMIKTVKSVFKYFDGIKKIEVKKIIMYKINIHIT